MAEKVSEKPVIDPLPSPQELCLTAPLYEGFRYDKDESNPLWALEIFSGSLDGHWHSCGRHTAFN